MTDDIVARLRSGFLSPTCALDAADEIKRLRAEIAAEREKFEREIICRRAEREQAVVERDDARHMLHAARAELAARDALLREAGPMVAFCYKYFDNETLLARIDALLQGGGDGTPSDAG